VRSLGPPLRLEVDGRRAELDEGAARTVWVQAVPEPLEDGVTVS
jgi:hypothetical protein